MNNARDHGGARSFNFGALLTASAIAAAVFVVVAVVGFTRPARKRTTVTTPYTQQVTFGYSAHGPAGPVYPTGAVHTGDPIFLSLVHQIGVHVNYTFATAAEHDIAGTEAIRLRLSTQSGWSRTIVLTPRTHFTGDRTSTVVTLDIPQIESLLNKVGALTGLPSAGYTLAVEPVVHVTGTVAGHPLNQSFAPSMSFQLGPQQLVSNGASATSGSSSAGGGSGSGGSSGSLTPSESGGVGTPSTAPATVTVLGVSPEVDVLRWIALLGLLLSVPIALYAFMRKRGEPFEESVHIQSQYGHLIVPIVAGEDLGWPPVDVPNIKALVRLAESGQRLILHNRSGDVDTYMVNDEGTVYRYQVKAFEDRVGRVDRRAGAGRRGDGERGAGTPGTPHTTPPTRRRSSGPSHAISPFAGVTRYRTTLSGGTVALISPVVRVGGPGPQIVQRVARGRP